MGIPRLKQQKMESLVVTLASCAGVVLLLQYNYATAPVAAGFGVVFYVFGTIVRKVGRALIYPFYISKLRNVPGPKVNGIYNWWQFEHGKVAGAAALKKNIGRKTKKADKIFAVI